MQITAWTRYNNELYTLFDELDIVRAIKIGSLVNKANLVHNLFLVCLFLEHLSTSPCFGQLRNHHQEKQFCFCDTWYCRWLSGIQEHMLLRTRQSSTQNNKYQVSHKHSCFSWWWARSCPKQVEIDKYTKNKLCTKLALFTILYRDARSTKHKK